jgi:hypothetical protein
VAALRTIAAGGVDHQLLGVEVRQLHADGLVELLPAGM